MPPVGTFLASTAFTVGKLSVTYGTIAAGALSLGISAYQRRQSKKALAALAAQASARSSEGYTVFGTGPQEEPAGQIVYGRRRVGGPVTYGELTNGGDHLHYIVPLAIHEIDAFESFHIDGEQVSLNEDGFVTDAKWVKGEGDDAVHHVRIKAHRGTPDQEVDDDLIMETSVDESFRMRECAYLYVRLIYEQEIFPGGVPAITATVRGKRCASWIDGEAAAWSSNAVRVLYDVQNWFLDTGPEDINVAAYNLGVETCDEDVDGQKRYEVHVATLAPVEHGALEGFIRDIENAMAGDASYSSGQWTVRAGKHQPAKVTLTDDDQRGELSVSAGTPDGQRGFGVAGSFTSRNNGYLPDQYPLVKWPLYKDGDPVLNVDLPFVDNDPQAQRIGRIILGKTEGEQISASGVYGLKALEVRPLQTIALTNFFMGWEEKLFEVVGWKLLISRKTGVRVQLALMETSETVYEWDSLADLVEFASNDTLLTVRPPPVGVTLLQELRIYNEEVTSVLIAIVTATVHSRIELVEAEYRLSGETVWRSMGTAPFGSRLEAIDIPDGRYDVRARATTWHGEPGPWTTILAYGFAPTDQPPDNVSGFGYELSGGLLHLFWDAVANLDLSHYQIRNSTRNNWETATVVIDKVARPATFASAPVRSGYWLIKAVNKRGRESVIASWFLIGGAEVPTLDTVIRLTEGGAKRFDGTHANTREVSRSGARGLELTAGSGAGTYVIGEKHDSPTNGVVDTDSERTIRVSSEVTWAPYSPNELLFDDLPGNSLDALSGLWDNLTDTDGLGQFAKVIQEVSYTSSDPDSGGARWSAWEVAAGQEVVGRAVRFRIRMTSERPDQVTPRILAITHTASY